ncbi:hypothetical protein ACFLZY_01990 [Patescibacteria group bacterium]
MPEAKHIGELMIHIGIGDPRIKTNTPIKINLWISGLVVCGELYQGHLPSSLATREQIFSTKDLTRVAELADKLIKTQEPFITAYGSDNLSYRILWTLKTPAECPGAD